MKTIAVRRTGVLITPDSARVLLRPFGPSREQAVHVCARVMMLPEADVHAVLEHVLTEFAGRHQQIQTLFKARYEHVKSYMLTDHSLSDERQLLLGAYFTQEYALEAAALFNPSIVPDPDQTGLPPGALRFVLSLRATGEGHISSITFRSGIIDAQQNITLDPSTRFLTEPQQIPNAAYEKALFERKLFELQLASPFSQQVLGALDELFTLEELRQASAYILTQVRPNDPESEHVARGMLLLAQSNYEVQFSAHNGMSERVIFPSSPSQTKGIEDARFVQFHNDDGTATYYATYTAFDGQLVLPQLLETDDFLHFTFSTMNGPAAQNKGMALFPRKINGIYAMLSRQDNQNIYLMYSDNIHFWYSPEVILRPTFPWELVQLGNCGSPLETEAGWLVLSHGVGPMRKYCIGAFLLDRDDPSKVIGRLREPLLTPEEHERSGYVPNVVYSCGALIHGGYLILPYAMSDYATNFATIALADILDAME